METIKFEDFAKVELLVGTVLEAMPFPEPKVTKLYILKVSLGSNPEDVRQICAGIREYYTVEELVGRQIVVVANLEPRQMRGEMSNGMLLAVQDATGKPILLTLSSPVPSGSKVS